MRASVLLLGLGVFFGLAGLASAGSLKGKVQFPAGTAMTDSDLFVVWTDACSVKAKPVGAVTLDEKDFHFSPGAVVAQVGQTLRIRNGDKAKHNSFALKNVTFDSGLQKPGMNYEVVLSKPGLTKIFCRIHSKMAAEVLVLNTGCYRELRGGGAGVAFELDNFRGGKDAKVWLWSPRLKAFRSASAGGAVFTLGKGDFLEIAPPKSEVQQPDGY